MLKKVHRKFTLLCVLLILFVLTVMTLIFLSVSEKNLKDNQLLTFNNDTSVILSNIEMTEVMTREWMNTIQYNGKYIISILDAGVLLWISNPTRDAEKLSLFEDMASARQDYLESFEIEFVHDIYPLSFNFYSNTTGENYFAYYNIIEKNEKYLSVSILYPLNNLENQIFQQRLSFFLIDFFAILILSRFASFFTKKILEPVEKNQQEQVRFVAAASHELRTPLAVIMSANNACRTAEPAERQLFHHTIESEGTRMSRLITDMLTLAKADSCAWSIKRKPAGLDTILLNSYESFEPIAHDKNIRLTVSIPEEEIPLCPFDADRITQVITILLHNAVSYTQKGGSIHISMTYNEKYMQFSVADNGPGIPDDEKTKVFERFYRVDSSRSKKDHFGLGLCIAREIIQAHHGSIRIIDTPGGGSTFICRLPAG